MAKKMKKLMAMMLVLCMMVSMFGMTAFAAEDGTVVETETMTDGGLTTNVTTTTTTTTDVTNNNVTVTVTIEKETTGTDSEGKTVTGQEVFTSTEVTDSNGEGISYNWEENGSEKKEWTEADNGDEAGQPEVTVKLELGQTTSGSATTTETTGDINSSEGQTTTTTTERVVEATTSESEARVEVEGTSEMKPLIPDRTIMDNEDLKDEQLLKEYTYSGGFEDYPETKAPEGYDYRFTGFGQMSMFGNATITTSGTEGRTGALQFVVEYDPFYDPDSTDNKDVADDEKFIGYCADIDTDGKDNYWYRIDSLEDAGYYDEEAAKYIRAIALNGYWGTSDEKDENGELQVGSLAKLKADMIAAVNAGTLTGITEEEINSITQGQAVNATQSAIWMYANESTKGIHVDPDRLIAKGYAKNREERVEPTEQDRANVKAIFNYLMGLAPMEKAEGMEVIDQDAFIKEDSMSITVGDKLAGHENNADDNHDNDVYDVSLNFALVVTPDSNGDDLVVQVITGFDADGKAIVAAQGRIAGGNAEEDAANGFNEVVYDEATGSYTLKGLALAEKSDFNFELKLVGTQYLEQGVYIFTSENRNGITSQTFVSVLEGKKEVNVSKGYVISFEVNEDNQIVSERVWHDEADPAVAPAAGVFAVPARPLNNIPDEEVPLADAPQTGDEAIVFAVLTVLAGFGLAAMHVSEQKRKAEEA